MPSDLTELFDRLRREPLATVLAGPEALRREGTRRRRVRRAVTAGLAAAAVAAVAVTLTAVLPAPLGLTPPPGVSASPTPTTRDPTPTRSTGAPTPDPTATAHPSPTLSLGVDPIPDAAFPSHSAVSFGGGGGGDAGTRTVLPELCGLVSTEVDFLRELADPTGLLANRLQDSMIDVPDPPEAPFPEGVMIVQVMRYEPGAAARFLDSLRAAVAACRTDPDARWGPFTFSAVTPAPGYGDETFAFVASHEVQDFEEPPYVCEELYEVVRVGDAVMVAEVSGWETCYTDPALDRELRDAAINAFIGWATTL